MNLYARKSKQIIIQNPKNSTFTINGQQKKIEATGGIAYLVVIGLIGISIFYIYAKYFHKKVRQKLKKNNKR